MAPATTNFGLGDQPSATMRSSDHGLLPIALNSGERIDYGPPNMSHKQVKIGIGNLPVESLAVCIGFFIPAYTYTERGP